MSKKGDFIVLVGWDISPPHKPPLCGSLYIDASDIWQKLVQNYNITIKLIVLNVHFNC